MKNSLFKRAFATVATVPVALAQCLTIANAVETKDNSAVVYTLTGENGLLTVDTEADYKLVDAAEDEKTYVAVSDWNDKLAAMMTQVGTGSVDVSDIVDEAVKRSGRYSELATAVAENLSEVKYTKDADGNLVLTVDIDNIASVFETIAQEYVDEAIEGIEIEYEEQKEAIDKLKNAKFFENIDISGTVKVVVNTSELANSTTVTAAVSFITGDVEYKGAAIENYAMAKLADVKAAAKGIAEIIDDNDLTQDEYNKQLGEMKDKLVNAESQIVKTVDSYASKIDAAVNKASKFETKTFEGSFADTGVAIAAAKARIARSKSVPAKVKNYVSKMTTAEAAASTDVATKIFTRVLNAINNSVAPSSVNVTASEVGAYIDGFENINVDVNNLVANVSATYDDTADFDAIKAYMLSKYNFEATESYMAVDVAANASDYKAGVVSVDFQLKRVVKGVEAVVTTTTTAKTTATTTASVTTTVVDPASTTTAVDPASTTTAKDPASTTTAKDPASTTTAKDPASTTTAKDPASTTTAVDPASTTTASPVTTAPVTVTESVTKVNYDVQAKNGFYFNIDDEYNIDQIESISAIVKKYIKVTDEAGEIIELLEDGEETIELNGKVDFGTQKPSDKSDSEIFSGRDIVVYAAEDIKDSEGNLIVAAGKALEVDDEEVTVKCYVGIKGDIDFSGAADAEDASAVLKLYARIQTIDDLSKLQFCPNTDVVKDSSSILDDFAAFLADVDADLKPMNFCTLKTEKERALDADDSSCILKMYALTQSGYNEDRATWDIVLGRTEEE